LVEPGERKEKEKTPPLYPPEEVHRYALENYVLLSDVRSDPDLLLSLPENQTREIIESTDSAYLLGLLRSRGSQLIDFAPEEKIDLAKPPADLRERLLVWIRDRRLFLIKETVRSLSAAEKWLLDRYLLDVEPGRRPNFDSEVRLWQAWANSRRDQVLVTREQFPSLAMKEHKQKDVFAAMPDQHEAHYARQANAAYIAAHPTLARLQSEGWNLDAATPAELGRMLEGLASPLPGQQPDLFYFIDPKSPQHDAMTHDISAAWLNRGGAPPSYLLHQNVEKFLDERRGQTIILIGHILGTDFAMDRGPDRAPLLIDMANFIRSAAARQVILVPIGCNSAASGAPFGFTRPIDSIEVAKFIAAIPRENIAIGDLMAAMGAIAPVWVNAHAIAEYLDVVIKQFETDNPRVLARFPASSYARPLPSPQLSPATAAGNTAALPANYQQFTNSWIEANRPWHDRGILRWLRSAARNTRGATLLIIAAMFASLDLVLQRVRRRVDGTTRAPGTKLHIAQMRVRLLWLTVAVIATIYVLWAPWLYITLGIVAALLLLMVSALVSQ
jgi:hypothetical protein